MEEKLVKLMELAFGEDLSGKAVEDCSPETIPGWDSLALLNLVSMIEDEFGVSLDIDDIAAMAEDGAHISAILAAKIEA